MTRSGDYMEGTHKNALVRKKVQTPRVPGSEWYQEVAAGHYLQAYGTTLYAGPLRSRKKPSLSLHHKGAVNWRGTFVNLPDFSGGLPLSTLAHHEPLKSSHPPAGKPPYPAIPRTTATAPTTTAVRSTLWHPNPLRRPPCAGQGRQHHSIRPALLLWLQRAACCLQRTPMGELQLGGVLLVCVVLRGVLLVDALDPPAAASG